VRICSSTGWLSECGQTEGTGRDLRRGPSGIQFLHSNHSGLVDAMKVDAKEVKRRLQSFTDVCRKQGLKTTHQRTEIYRELARTREHPDADTIYKRVRRRIPAISLDTVYRTLRLLEEEGVIARVGILEERNRFDAHVEDHHHFVCTHCGAMRDVHGVELNGTAARAAMDAIGTVSSVHVELRGTCRQCQEPHGRTW